MTGFDYIFVIKKTGEITPVSSLYPNLSPFFTDLSG